MAWNKIESLNNASLEELQKLMLVLGSKLDLRILYTEQQPLLELFCDSDEYLYTAEVILHQAYADLKLREKIQTKSQFDISLIIESILSRT